MTALAPRYGGAWNTGEFLEPATLNARLRAAPGNLLRNADFRAAQRVDANSATFAYWTTTGNADASNPRRLLLDAGEYASQNTHLLLGAGQAGQDALLGAILRLTGSGARARITVTWASGDADTIEVGSADLPADYVFVWAPTSTRGTATEATYRVENVGTADQVEVHLAVLGWGSRHRGPLVQREGSGGGGVAWGGVYDGGTMKALGGARLLRVEDVRITTSAAGTSASTTFDLATVAPAGTFVSGDLALAWAVKDNGEDRVANVIEASISGSTLTVLVRAANGLTFAGGTFVCNVLVLIVPVAQNVGSRGASKRAHPYG